MSVYIIASVAFIVAISPLLQPSMGFHWGEVFCGLWVLRSLSCSHGSPGHDQGEVLRLVHFGIRMFPKVEKWPMGRVLRPSLSCHQLACHLLASLAHAGSVFVDPFSSGFPARGRVLGLPSPTTLTMAVVSWQPSLGACVVELEFPSHWFSQGSATRAELAYTLEPAAEGPGGCGPGGEEDPGEQALPVGSVELRPADPPQHQEVPLDEAVTLRVPDVPVRPGQLFSATLLLRHNFTAGVLTLR